MVKRCSAKNCYNSQYTHKIGYFGYPKNEETAKEWALRAGRSDLLEKSIGNLTKYYLCSDHFTANDMMNPEVADKSFLRLKKSPEIPIPSVFEDNLMKNVQSAVENADKFVTYSKSRTAEQLTDFESSNIERRSMNLTEKLLTGNLAKRPKIEVIETRDIVDEITFESVIEKEEYECIDGTTCCRLCTKDSLDLIAIFDDDGNFHSETECLNLMPQGIIAKDDGLPQFTCTECLEKLQSCANIINGFVLNQNLFVS